MADVTVTIGMPVFNNGETLARAVQSVQAQVRSDWHLIITDDQSGDNSFRIAEDLASDDPRITVMRNDERLVYRNFAKSLTMAETPLFTWLAADDYWGPRFLEHAITALETNPEAVSALPACQFTDASGGPYLPSLMLSRTERLRSYLKAPGGTRMYGVARTDILRRAFPARGMHAYDWHLMLGVLNAGPQISLPAVQLYRQKTPVARYTMDAETQKGMFKWFPVLDMSITAWRNGFVPFGNFGDLLGLNLRKHEEYMAYRQPALFGRVRWLYQLLGLPISRSPQMLRDAAEASLNTARAPAARALLEKTEVLTKPRVPAKPSGPPRILALVTCRNAAPTLGALLKNLDAHGADVIVIDNGSTDATRAIAEAAKDGPVKAIHDDPFRGYFDLTRQLHLKRDLIRKAHADWIIHADADEFLDSPTGGALRDYLAEVPSHVTAFVCDEDMYLPEDDLAQHGAEDFETTMRGRVKMIERNAKERVFRASARLDRWLDTGGHSVTDGGLARAKEHLPLRHYFALSLDQVRAEYLSRVYAPHDLAKFWHGARRTETVDIVAPQKGLLSVADTPRSLRAVPVFAARKVVSKPSPPAGTDLALSADPAIAREVVKMIAAVFPGLRLFLGVGPAPLPHLHVIAHPAAHYPATDVAGAERWLRQIAGFRQHALVTHVPFSECRIEDIETPALHETIAGLLLGEGKGVAASNSLPTITNFDYQGRLVSITSGLAADLGYA